MVTAICIPDMTVKSTRENKISTMPMIVNPMTANKKGPKNCRSKYRSKMLRERKLVKNWKGLYIETKMGLPYWCVATPSVVGIVGRDGIND